MEVELRKLYLGWIVGLSMDDPNLQDKLASFQRRSTALIERLGGQAASLGALADFPVPKTLELSPYVGKVYDQMQQAAISASITAGLNSRDAAQAMFRAGMDKSYRRLERLARTETVSAYWKNQWDSVADLPLLVMVWSSEESKRTCDYCLSRDGLVVDDSSIRDHPNGRCTLVPTLRSQVKYKGTLQPDGSVDMDPAWSRQGKATQKAPASTEFTADEISAGTMAAERQRVALERDLYVNKGKRNEGYNEALGWSRDTYKARGSYIEMGNKDMNAILRDPKAYAAASDYDEFFAEMFGKYIDDLTELIGKNKLADDIIVARGVTVAPSFNPATFKVGDNFADPAFLSTSTKMEEALDFASGRGAGAEGWTFITKAPKGTNAIAGADYQNEIIFKPGQMQRVVGVDPVRRIVYTEMIP